MATKTIYAREYKRGVKKDGTVVYKKFIKNLYKYEFVPEIWDTIKEFAGIYDIGIKWEMPLAKFSRGIKSVCRFSITNVNNSNISLDRRISVLKRGFWSYLNKGKLHKIGTKKDILELLEKEFNPPKEKRELWTPPDYLKVGDELLYEKRIHTWKVESRVGVIQKINKNSIVIRDYKFYKVEDDNAWRNQTHGTNYLVLLKKKPLDDKNIIIKSKKFYDKYTCDDYRKTEFDRIPIRVDYGN